MSLLTRISTWVPVASIRATRSAPGKFRSITHIRSGANTPGYRASIVSTHHAGQRHFTPNRYTADPASRPSRARPTPEQPATGVTHRHRRPCLHHRTQLREPVEVRGIEP